MFSYAETCSNQSSGSRLVCFDQLLLLQTHVLQTEDQVCSHFDFLCFELAFLFWMRLKCSLVCVAVHRQPKTALNYWVVAVFGSHSARTSAWMLLCCALLLGFALTKMALHGSLLRRVIRFS